MGVKIKICGLFRTIDADYVNEARPDYTGFVFYEKSRRYVTSLQASTIRSNLDKGIKTVGVFVNAEPERIQCLYEKGIIQVIQLHGQEDEAYLQNLRTLLPNAEIWQAFFIHSTKDLIDAMQSNADQILLDNGYGTGKCFDWKLIEGKLLRYPVLAGGLTPELIPGVIAKFQPYAVDISSGVETNQVKDRVKILAAVKAAREETNVL